MLLILLTRINCFKRFQGKIKHNSKGIKLWFLCRMCVMIQVKKSFEGCRKIMLQLLIWYGFMELLQSNLFLTTNYFYNYFNLYLRFFKFYWTIYFLCILCRWTIPAKNLFVKKTSKVYWLTLQCYLYFASRITVVYAALFAKKSLFHCFFFLPSRMDNRHSIVLLQKSDEKGFKRFAINTSFL